MTPDRSRTRGRPDPATPGTPGPHLHRFLHHSHLFSAAVGEVLVAACLDDVSPRPLSRVQILLLKLISLDGPRQVGEMADLLGLSSPAASKNVDKLERLGLVERLPDRGDRRATLVTASGAGRRLVRRYEARKVSRLEPALGEFDPEEIRQLTTLLQRFAVSLLGQQRLQRGFCLRCGVHVEADCPVARLRGGCPFGKARDGSPREGIEA